MWLVAAMADCRSEVPYNVAMIAFNRIVATAAFVVLLISSALAQNDQPADKPDSLERMVRDGMIEALDSRLGSSTRPEDLHALALAATNKAIRQREEKARQASFQDAERRFTKWIESVEKVGETPTVRAAKSAAAIIESSGMILSRWVAPELDEYEISLTLRGDASRMAGLLEKARRGYEDALKRLEPVARELDRGGADVEEKFLSAGILELVPQSRRDAKFNLGWTCAYAAMLETANAETRKNLLKSAETAFHDLIALNQDGEVAARCQLGLGLVMRLAQRPEDSLKALEAAARETPAGAIAVQIAYERARTLVVASRFDEARATLKPLLEVDLEKLPPSEQPARFFYNLALVWDANSYLVEAAQLSTSAAKSADTARARADAVRVAKLREEGIGRLRKLSERGGPWPALVQKILATTVPLDADIRTLSPSELLIVARNFIEQKRYPQALLRLEEAAKRPALPPAQLEEILLESADCRVRGDDGRRAAETYDRVLSEFPRSTRAEQAAALSAQLWASVADSTKQPDDYQRLAASLQRLLERYPGNEHSAQARWWLPLALESAGLFDDATKQYAAIAKDSPHWEEAQFRIAMCRRLTLDQNSDASRDPKQVRGTVDALLSYSSAADKRSSATTEKALAVWTATARLSAAELLAQPPLSAHDEALKIIDDLEARGVDELTGRLLAVRITALRALSRLDEAAAVVDRFLKSVSPDKAGAVLTNLARGLQEELDRLEQEGRADALRGLAAASLPTFEQLDKWVAADEKRAPMRDAVRYALARSRYFSGELDEALATIEPIAASDKNNGAAQRLFALVLTARLTESATTSDLAKARDAWAALLRDGELRRTQPERFWEARFHFLSILLREGRAADVKKALDQERIWSPDLATSSWARRFEELYAAATAKTAP